MAGVDLSTREFDGQVVVARQSTTMRARPRASTRRSARSPSRPSARGCSSS